ncbi:MAG: DegT/DnrJ/EryC1/StrS family aminotransferase [Deltaproteobacteria bacterium]|nr:DegT/DnrJ/EryC1/StrS family aminotransferase [Deltaproteobacteria bacterium]
MRTRLSNRNLPSLLPDVARHYPLAPKLAWNYAKLLTGRPVLRSVDFAFTFECQCNCTHCYAKPMFQPGGTPLTTLQFKSAIDQSLALGAVTINFVGGEPLCDPQVYELVAHIPRRRAASLITTNGYDLDRMAVAKLKSAGLSYAAVSLDFDDAKRHDEFRRKPGLYERARAGIELLRAAGIGVIINTTVTQETMDDGTVERLVAYAKAIGARITLAVPSMVGNWECRGEVVLKPGSQAKLDSFHRLPHVRWDGQTNYLHEGCAAGIEKISISAYGDVLPCGLIHVTFGNLKDEPLEAIWRRMISVPEFSRIHERCITSSDHEFIERYIKRINEEKVRPVPSGAVFPLPFARPREDHMPYKIPRARVYFSPEAAAAAARVIRQNGVHDDDFVRELSREFARYLGSRGCRATGSGRQALFIALKALGVRDGDEVVMPSYTCRVVVPAVLLAGAKPVFCDVDPDTYNMTAATIEPCISPRTRFILMTHIHGQPCRVDEILALARERGIAVIEDAAASTGAEYHQKKTGRFGKIGCFSFSMYKNLNTLYGGMLSAEDDETLESIDRVMAGLDLHDPPTPELMKRLGFAISTSFLTHPLAFSLSGYWGIRFINSLAGDFVNRALVTLDDGAVPSEIPAEYRERMSGLQAAIGLAGLARLDLDNMVRMRNGRVLDRELKFVPGLKPPARVERVTDIVLNYVVQTPRREEVIARLLGRGIDVNKGYLESCSGLPMYKAAGASCPVSDGLVENKLYLPVDPPLAEREMMHIADSLKDVLKELGVV